jgi:diguanylate cyclase (GGDEF)-like protein
VVSVAAICLWRVSEGTLKTVVWVAIPLLSGAVTLVGARRSGQTSKAWRLIAISIATFGVGELVLTSEERGWYQPPTLAPSYFVYLAANFTMLVGFVQLVKQAAPRLDRMEWIDCAIVTIGPGCLVWQFVIAPLAPAAHIGVFDRGFLVGILVFDFAFALMAWRLLAGRFRLVSGIMLLASPLLMAVADIAYDLGVLRGGSSGGTTDVLYPISWALLAFAPFHPSIRTLTSPDSKKVVPVSRHHFWSLAAVASIAPVAGLAEELSGGTDSLVAVSIATVVVFLLVVYRMRILVSELERAGKDLQRAATHDSLTGLANRAMLMDRLGHALARRPDADNRCALVYADLNGFKASNDTFGHHVGDQLLILAGQRLLEACRRGDTVARLGGDEFIVLIDGATTDVVATVAERVRAALRITEVGGISVNVSASIGLAFESLNGCSPADLLQEADQAMYVEKSSDRTRRGSGSETSSLLQKGLSLQIHDSSLRTPSLPLKL